MIEIDVENLSVHEIKTNPNFSISELYKKHDINEAHKIISMLTGALGVAIAELSDKELKEELNKCLVIGRKFNPYHYSDGV